MISRQFAAQVAELAIGAGHEILKIYGAGELSVVMKSDNSPLTEADQNSHAFIVSELRKISPLPILSEEAANIPWSQRRTWSQYWLVDPLDGTKEFIKGNGEFTVNIALIEDGEPIFGVVYVPISQTLYYGGRGLGAQKVVGRGSEPTAIRVAPVPRADDPWRIVGSRSFSTAEFDGFVARFKQPQVLSVGSSLKLCLVAEGRADLYPRMGPTSEWDTAAAHAIVAAAGGRVIDWETKKDLCYNSKESLLNPSFVVCADVSSSWID